MINKRLRDYIHFYPRANTKVPNQRYNPRRKLTGIFWHDDSKPSIFIGNGEGSKSLSTGYKLVLRPLSMATDFEKGVLDFWETPEEIVWTPEKVRFATSKWLDIFNLINEGLVISMETIELPASLSDMQLTLGAIKLLGQLKYEGEGSKEFQKKTTKDLLPLLVIDNMKQVAKWDQEKIDEIVGRFADYGIEIR